MTEQKQPRQETGTSTVASAADTGSDDPVQSEALSWLRSRKSQGAAGHKDHGGRDHKASADSSSAAEPAVRSGSGSGPGSGDSRSPGEGAS